VTTISQQAGDEPSAVIPGLPARAEPGIQRAFAFGLWIPGSAARPRNDELRIVADRISGSVR
jgi:hypothetical protein